MAQYAFIIVIVTLIVLNAANVYWLQQSYRREAEYTRMLSSCYSTSVPIR
jgi:hypothetical protein